MKTLAYLLVMLVMCLLMALWPTTPFTVWEPRFIVPLTAALFVLLVWLVARFLGTDGTPFEILVTAAFLLLFSPSAAIFFSQDEEAVIELSSQCIVPFFLSQYNRIRSKDFRRVYALMLLMGIFCSFTHDGITLPLCLSFLLMAWQRRAEVLHRACWPMMAGWLIGTILQFVSRDHLPSLAPDLAGLTSRTALILGLLWDTKVFVLAVGLTAWFTTTAWGRTELRRAWRRNRLVAYSLAFALFTVPFAPLGIDNAVTSVCFFAMLWCMLLLLGLERQWEGRRLMRERNSSLGVNQIVQP